MPNLVFLGTPEAAVPSLRALSRDFDVGLVITRPDRPRGRSGRPQPPPVKTAAQELGLEVAQPADRRELGQIVGEEVDLGIVVAFGMILDPDVLAAPGGGFLNVHFSLLPRWRGAAPVERAIMAGDTTTGVSIMVMDEGLDTGPVLTRWETAIGPDETGGGLTGRLARAGADLLVEAVPAWLEGSLRPRPQPEEGVTYAARLGPDDRHLGVADGPIAFVDRTRALAPHPGARLIIDGEPHKVLAAAPTGEQVEPGRWAEDGGRPLLGLEGGTVEISVVQPPGKRPMSGRDWLRGRPLPTTVG